MTSRPTRVKVVLKVDLKVKAEQQWAHSSESCVFAAGGQWTARRANGRRLLARRRVCTYQTAAVRAQLVFSDDDVHKIRIVEAQIRDPVGAHDVAPIPCGCVSAPQSPTLCRCSHGPPAVCKQQSANRPMIAIPQEREAIIPLLVLLKAPTREGQNSQRYKTTREK